MIPFAVIGWTLFLALCAVYARDDKRADRIARRLATAEQTINVRTGQRDQARERAERAERALAMEKHPAGRVLPFRGRSE